MPIFANTFTCPKGHTFTANAKIHTRCPECLVRVRRTVEEKPAPAVTDNKVDNPEPKPRGPVLLKRGRTDVPRKPVSKVPVKSPAKPTAKTTPKTTAKPAVKVPKIAGGLVKRSRVTQKVTPTISRTPQKTAVARFTKAGGSQRNSGSYTDQMMKRAGF